MTQNPELELVCGCQLAWVFLVSLRTKGGYCIELENCSILDMLLVICQSLSRNVP